jgi:uncharacterized protein YecA (UPF0149 family)
LNSNLFYKPVIILAAPRSGSTFLFEILSKSQDFYTIGDESHKVIEGLPQFNLKFGLLDSNQLTADDLDEQSVLQLRDRFYSKTRNNKNILLSDLIDKPSKVRFLEKTPKNSLRISMLNKLFPDALFIYLYRDPKENISSIIDAWESQRFITYPRLVGRKKPWSLLLPKGWQNYSNSTTEQSACFQWRSANESIINDLKNINKQRWTAISYSQLKENTQDTIEELCKFCNVTKEGLDIETDKDKLSVNTLTAPKKNKWYKNADLLAIILPELFSLIEKIKRLMPSLGIDDLELMINQSLVDKAKLQRLKARQENQNKGSSSDNVGRNDPCHCLSGKRFKHCHGSLN